MENTIFRKKTIDRISSPEQLTDYLKVTNPSIWIILSAVILIIIGFLAWASVGTLKTTVASKAVVVDKKASIVPLVTNDNHEIEAGMKVEIAGSEYIISSVEMDEFGRQTACVPVDLSDGKYNSEIVVEEIHPISFLFEGR